MATNSDAATAWDDQRVWSDAGFLRFLEEHDVSTKDLLTSSRDGDSLRFFRLKQLAGNNAAEGGEPRLQDIAASLAREAAENTAEGVGETVPQAVSWLPGFYSLPVSAPLARVDLYKGGQLYGIDISSGYAVSLLDVKPGEHVLDLCCAPGAKLTMIADLLQLQGSVTGVDFSRPRLGACRQLVHKYQLFQPESEAERTEWRCRLFHADGRTFNIGPKTECAHIDGMEVLLDTQEIASRAPKDRMRKRKNKSARARDAKRQKLLVLDSALYDKVLVDAECTHDGSIRHLQRLDTAAKWEEYVRDHLNSSEVERILKLQHGLIRNGFNLLQPGGIMIYSTCSLSVKQNEDIVSSFLQDEPLAKLDPIARSDDVPCQEGKLPGTIRFTPSQNTSGLFIARIRKETRH
ncbi:tRNA cytosine-5-methylases and related enzymes of the NOL1/NOP2/sun superfamily [Phytophthora cinnamomi]|uniref:tRNA cytosine-5-methylases and related enzymes of the NOL1/NOP2/sun superfamily n=1 Tax=Phytophthora cinnamomi TaxID=4785 RepID=UPI00355A990E|nr:tRNA cytosine-5-methylases and related enzymes of the NOL1/NOP2/sun superfamily [Phytophthora cinnamomi]